MEVNMNRMLRSFYLAFIFLSCLLSGACATLKNFDAPTHDHAMPEVSEPVPFEEISNFRLPAGCEELDPRERGPFVLPDWVYAKSCVEVVDKASETLVIRNAHTRRFRATFRGQLSSADWALQATEAILNEAARLRQERISQVTPGYVEIEHRTFHHVGNPGQNAFCNCDELVYEYTSTKWQVMAASAHFYCAIYHAGSGSAPPLITTFTLTTWLSRPATVSGGLGENRDFLADVKRLNAEFRFLPVQ
jgi:hypothetical protein